MARTRSSRQGTLNRLRFAFDHLEISPHRPIGLRASFLPVTNASDAEIVAHCKFGLRQLQVVNLKTAKTLGIDLPATVLTLADEVTG
jgi:hypothetical protein